MRGKFRETRGEMREKLGKKKREKMNGKKTGKKREEREILGRKGRFLGLEFPGFWGWRRSWGGGVKVDF